MSSTDAPKTYDCPTCELTVSATLAGFNRERRTKCIYCETDL
ncbi:hypothetical protein ACFQGT_00155 [Natrialbaceae archaeon GCM10025810]